LATPFFQSLMLHVLEAAATGEVKVGEVVERLAAKLRLSSEDRDALLPSGKQTVFANRTHWAKTYLTQAGLLERTGRGRFRITSAGQQVLAQNPKEIDIEFLKQFPSFREFQSRTRQSKSDIETLDAENSMEEQSALAPDETMRAAQQQLEAALASDLLARVIAAPPEFFERAVIKLLLAMGYGGSAAEAARALGRSGDGGVDGVIDQDALGLDRVYVQAKRYALDNAVGAGAIRDFFGSLDRFKATKGLFVTTSSFTTAARETSEYLSKRLVLIDGVLLSKLMIRYEVGCRVEETLFIKRLDEEFFE
jgi:restriction system protein